MRYAESDMLRRALRARYELIAQERVMSTER